MPSDESLQRIALLPANVLIADPSSQWMSAAIPLALREDLATSPRIAAALAKDESAAYLQSATEVLRTTVESRQGRTRIEGTITSLSTQRNLQVFSIETGSAEILPEINALAKRIDARASDFSTRNVRALQAFAMGAESPDTSARANLLKQAVAIDPAFGLAYIAGAETTGLNSGPLLATAAKYRSSFTPFDRARFDALSSRFSHAPLTVQGNAEAAVLRSAPNDLDALLALGSIRFLQGDGAAGQGFLHRALDLSPGNENIKLRLAEGLLETKRFADAEKILSSLPATPVTLPQLAVCLLLKGDVPRANSTAARLLASVSNVDVKALFHASWLALSGERQKAIDYLKTWNAADVNLRTIAWSDIAVWQAMGNDFADAKKSAGLAVQQAKRPTAFATIAMLIAQCDEAPDRWKQQVNAAVPDGEQRQLALGYGLFLGGHYPEAAEVWRKTLENSGGADLRARAMLASSLDHAGNSAEARKILVEPFVPDFGDLYGAISFAEMRRLIQ